jgi:hypothetical protein
VKTTLTNERGNAITVEVELLPERGGIGYVRLVLAGPDSTAENIVTRAEAVTLRNLLTQTLA